MAVGLSCSKSAGLRFGALSLQMGDGVRSGHGPAVLALDQSPLDGDGHHAGPTGRSQVTADVDHAGGVAGGSASWKRSSFGFVRMSRAESARCGLEHATNTSREAARSEGASVTFPLDKEGSVCHCAGGSLTSNAVAGLQHPMHSLRAGAVWRSRGCVTYADRGCRAAQLAVQTLRACARVALNS